MNKHSKTFCILPWMHIATTTTGMFRPCCNIKEGFTLGKYRIHQDDIRDVWHSKEYQDLRQQMLDGVRPDACERCFREEDSGVSSSRQGYNNKFMFDYEKTVTPPANIKYIDIRLGNLCNLKCRMCNPWASNQWIKEWKLISAPTDLSHLNSLDWPEDERVWDNLSKVVDDVEEIYLTGGEPTIIKKQYHLYELLIKQGKSKNITLKYNTNLTKIPEKLIGYWKHFRQIKLNASIDAFGELDTYIRHPSKWSIIDANLKHLQTISNVKLTVHCTVQIYNVLKVDQLFEYLEGLGIDVYLNILNHPYWLNIRVLPDHLKENVALKFEKQYSISISKKDAIVDYMFEEDWSHLLPEFFDKTEKLDKARNENFRDLVPEMFI